MDPFFTEEQLNNMSRENMMEVMRIMQNQVQKKRDRGTASERQAERTGIYERNAFRPSCACTKKTFRFFQ
jgi:hypothetical protein